MRVIGRKMYGGHVIYYTKYMVLCNNLPSLVQMWAKESRVLLICFFFVLVLSPPFISPINFDRFGFLVTIHLSPSSSATRLYFLFFYFFAFCFSSPPIKFRLKTAALRASLGVFSRRGETPEQKTLELSSSLVVSSRFSDLEQRRKRECRNNQRRDARENISCTLFLSFFFFIFFFSFFLFSLSYPSLSSFASYWCF